MLRFGHRRNTSVSTFLAGLALLLLPSLAAAQGPGVRGGVSVDPDQFYFGGHYETTPLIDRLRFKPNIEIGIGDDLTHVGVNFEFVYKYSVNNAWSLYAGAGPAINFYSFDDVDDGQTEPGLNILFGAEAASGLFFEVKLGTIDSPELKFGVGFTFR
jgi:hypothetical protein